MTLPAGVQTVIPQGYFPLPWQRELHEADCLVKWCWASRRSGKSRAGVQEDLANIMEAAETSYIHRCETKDCPIPDGLDLTDTLVPAIHVWTVAPTRAQMRQVWNEMKEFIPGYMVRKPTQRGGRGGPVTGFKEDDFTVWLDMKDEQGNWLDVPRQSVYWEMKSADNVEALQTVGVDFLHIVEAQDIKEAAWNKLEPILTSAGRLGRAMIEGIPPRSRAHWFSKGYRFAQENPSDLGAAFHAEYTDNYFLTKQQLKQIENRKERMPIANWERMYMAKQDSEGDGFFRGAERAAKGYERSEPENDIYYVAGLDLARSQDETVLIIKDGKTSESVSKLVMSRIGWETQEEAILLECQKWGVQRLQIDSNNIGDVIADHLLSAGLPVERFKFTAQSKKNLFDNYAVALEKGRVVFPAEWQKLVNQLESIEDYESGNLVLFRTVDGGHDDWVDAECLAQWVCDPDEQEEILEGQIVSTIRTMTPIGQIGRSGAATRILRERKIGRVDAIVNGEPVEF